MTGTERLERAGREVMVAMVLADEVVLGAEVEAMVKASCLLPGEPLDEEQAREALQSTDVAHVIDVVREVAPTLDEQERELLFTVALGIAAADGELADEEKLLLTTLGELLGMDVLEALVDLFDDDGGVLDQEVDADGLRWMDDLPVGAEE